MGVFEKKSGSLKKFLNVRFLSVQILQNTLFSKTSKGKNLIKNPLK